MRIKSRPILLSSTIAKLTLFVLAVNNLVLSAIANDDPPVYEVGNTPDQRVWYDGTGRELAFTMSAPTLGDNPTITMSVSQSQTPDGTLSFDEAEDRFSYVPAATDLEPFTVAFLAVGDGTPIVQEVVIEPIHPLMPETQTFGLDVVTALPDDENNDKYFSYREVVQSQNKVFNESDETGVSTRNVSISGKTIVLEKNHSNGFFEKIHYDPNDSAYSNQDIESLKIVADILIIKDSLRLPQTNVSIQALEIIFEDKSGQTTTLSTTPLPLLPIPNHQPQEKQDFSLTHKQATKAEIFQYSPKL